MGLWDPLAVIQMRILGNNRGGLIRRFGIILKEINSKIN